MLFNSTETLSRDYYESSLINYQSAHYLLFLAQSYLLDLLHYVSQLWHLHFDQQPPPLLIMLNLIVFYLSVFID